MTLKIIGAGFGRTGTLSLKLALEQLGFGPCHHMKEVAPNPRQIDLWADAVAGKPDFHALFDGYVSTVDWPTAAFWPDVMKAFPNAKVILSTRSAESWYDSISSTILAVLADRTKWPEPARPWLNMVHDVVVTRSLGGRLDREGIIAAYEANEAAARAKVPSGKLLVFEAKEGWAPLCAFLDCPVPDTPYPRTNSKDEFFELMGEVAPD